jgi:hypothetical protein
MCPIGLFWGQLSDEKSTKKEEKKKRWLVYTKESR